jgi:acetyl/propionyl-CoA carboxylase alpha subunit/acetyl-CoA carboxylase carboxyltransferase component
MEGLQVPLHKRVLIANRGEIAIRIARAARGLGMESVGVYAPQDEFALHTRLTTSARPIGHADDPIAAYLDAEALVGIATELDCDCLHPGYGFLSETQGLAVRCSQAGIAFVGPPAAVLALFGDKLKARELASSLEIPVVSGSPASFKNASAAGEFANQLGYPVMLKAAAGGGGRGMRRVESEDQLTPAYERCRSEAEAAFGDGSVFMEKLVENPRHIEVQILADSEGNVVHLHERDCSVQLRNQKVVEVAPAPNLDPAIAERIRSDAIRLVRAAGYENAGTVEFLVVPESNEYYFIECNPRIQVEHTVTEQVTGIDLIQAQFRLAAGETLAQLGLADQAAVGAPHGFAVQSRVVVRSAGQIHAYREPSGVGVRVDACGYLGYAPPGQFDPLLAKLICSGNTYAAAVDRSLLALDEFHIEGVDTNLGHLRGILEHGSVKAGDARTSLLDNTPELDTTTALFSAPGSTLALLNERATALGMTAAPGGQQVEQTRASLIVGVGNQTLACPMQSEIVEVRVNQGDLVIAGQILMVVSAMKMETALEAPCSGIVTAVQELSAGDSVTPGQVLAVLEPRDDIDAPTNTPDAAEPPWAAVLAQVDDLRDMAKARLAPDSEEPGVVRQRNRGKLTCRERIELLLDQDSFREVGSVAGFTTYDDEGAIAAFTPANSIGGWGTVDGRMSVVCADDFTSRGGHADGAIGAKSGYLDRLALEMRIPSIRMLDGSSGGGSVAAMVPQQKKDGESSAQESRGAIKAGRPRVSGGGGSFLPGHLGSTMYTEQLATIPVVNLLLGSVVGIGAAKAVLGHFSVMVRDIAQLFVAGPPVVSHAMGYDISKEDLGGWHIHCVNGSVDNLAESEEEAVAMTRQFLSYLPTSVYEAPPVIESHDDVDRREDDLSTLIARKRTTTFDVRRAIELMADKGSFFEIGSLWGTDQVTGFVRFNGHPLGVIASDSLHINGGALTADGCDKLKRHLDVCDLFHIPILNLVDNPGFAVGLEHEMAGTIRKGGEWMVAFAQVSVPIFTVIMRRSFGVAGNNYASPRSRPSVRVVWPAADVGGIPPEGGIEAAYKRQLAEAEDPAALRAELNARIESARGPTGPLNKFQMEEMIDPRDTRRLICEWVEAAYRVVSQPARLVPRALQFRP